MRDTIDKDEQKETEEILKNLEEVSQEIYKSLEQELEEKDL